MSIVRVAPGNINAHAVFCVYGLRSPALIAVASSPIAARQAQAVVRFVIACRSEDSARGLVLHGGTPGTKQVDGLVATRPGHQPIMAPRSGAPPAEQALSVCSQSQSHTALATRLREHSRERCALQMRATISSLLQLRDIQRACVHPATHCSSCLCHRQGRL